MEVLDYGLIAASIAIAIIAVVNDLGGSLYAKFGGIPDQLAK